MYCLHDFLELFKIFEKYYLDTLMFMLKHPLSPVYIKRDFWEKLIPFILQILVFVSPYCTNISFL